jgi:uncharacterized membrane protein YqhA
VSTGPKKLFEKLLWQSRMVVLFAVVSSLLVGLAMFYMATVDALYLLSHLLEYASPSLTSEARSDLRSENVTHIVEIVDGYLLATVLLIFSLGLYELFISKIEAAEKSQSASNVLVVHSLDDLKNRLAKVILMILIVKFFEHAISLTYTSTMDILLLAGGIALIGLALFLSHQGEKHPN